MNLQRKNNQICCVGTKVKQRCGMTATVTRYDSFANIDIVFSDGTEVFGVTMGNFRKGCIGHPLHRHAKPNSLSDD